MVTDPTSADASNAADARTAPFVGAVTNVTRFGSVNVHVSSMIFTPNWYAVDASSAFVRTNSYMCPAWCVKIGAAQTSDELFADERGELYLDQDRQVRATGRLRKTSHAHPADGSMHISHKTVAPVRDRKGAIIGTMAVYRQSEKPQPLLDWHGRIKRVTAYVNAHPKADHTLAKLAVRAETTPSKLARAFLKILRVTPAEYVTTIRVDRARRQLESTDDSLTAIARSCGFYDLSHFFRVFRRAGGLTPSEYRASHRAISSVTPDRTPAR